MNAQYASSWYPNLKTMWNHVKRVKLVSPMALHQLAILPNYSLTSLLVAMEGPARLVSVALQRKDYDQGGGKQFSYAPYL